ncbi:MetQ/NlpA family ABC transporter substrate-binding protein [Tepidibacillus infernus]|uniref:Lipoprotein n=1 Tax=Tepidibacillus decaturensis TaxID=1413211 RepID=A0A135L5A1_9BACI|nr:MULTISPECIES: MetQ/NlpA family ABC transporter substrate-binding protein [Tepidibacillus]KXG44192.1 methionine ABC transporter substrate-binding protein [Tepidibacillus decaturensis]GBF10291.1 D-methionine-binding lipoprotein MetQ precursor [Tepidibacillus sp. HK-1]
MKKTLAMILFFVLAIGSVLTGCSSTETAGEKEVTIKVGVSSGDRIWPYLKEKAAKEGINIEIVEFSDYVRPNMALADGDIDLNAFQTYAYFVDFIKTKNLDLAPLATTLIAPMGLYSDKYKSPEEIPNGAEIAVPDDATNMGRALLLLQSAGLIKLKDGFNGIGDLESIVENPKGIKITPLTAGQTPRVLPDVAASVINNGYATEAGFNPVEDSIYLEDKTAKPYINIIAVRSEDKDKEVFKKIAELYQQDDVAEFIKNTYKGAIIPTFIPVSELESK